MAKYVNKNFDRFLSWKDLKENILKENPVTRNINPAKVLDHSQKWWKVDKILWLKTILKLFSQKLEMSWVKFAGYGQSSKKQ